MFNVGRNGQLVVKSEAGKEKRKTPKFVGQKERIR